MSDQFAAGDAWRPETYLDGGRYQEWAAAEQASRAEDEGEG